MSIYLQKSTPIQPRASLFADLLPKLKHPGWSEMAAKVVRIGDSPGDARKDLGASAKIRARPKTGKVSP